MPRRGGAIPSAVEDPVLPTLAEPGELFMVVPAGATARCEAWTIDAAHGALIAKQGGDQLVFEVSDWTLRFTELDRYRGGEYEETISCSGHFRAHETGEAIVLDSAKLFRATSSQSVVQGSVV